MKDIKSNESKGIPPEKEKKEIVKKNNHILQRREALKRMAILAVGGITGAMFIGSCEKDGFRYSDYSDYSDYSNYYNYYSNYYSDYYNYADYYYNYYSNYTNYAP